MEVIHLGNNATHGTMVSREAALWVLEAGPQILDTLDRILKEHDPNS